MPTLRRALVVLLAVAAMFAALALTRRAQAAVAPLVSAPSVQEYDRVLGTDTYLSQCQPCHGATGKGDGPAARFLEAQPRDLTAGAWMYLDEATVASIAGLVRRGIPGTEMEPFEELLLEEEIAAVAAYVFEEFASSAE